MLGYIYYNKGNRSLSGVNNIQICIVSRNVVTHDTICSIFVDIYYLHVFVDVLTDFKQHCNTF